MVSKSDSTQYTRRLYKDLQMMFKIRHEVKNYDTKHKEDYQVHYHEVNKKIIIDLTDFSDNNPSNNENQRYYT